MGNKVLRLDITQFVNPHGSDIKGSNCDKFKIYDNACDTYVIVCVKTHR